MTCPHCGARNLDDADFCGKCRQPLGQRALDLAPTEHTLAPGTLLLNRYCIVRKLGAGGMGQVYLADDRTLRVQVAIKTVRSLLGEDPGAIVRLVDEARAAMRLAHEHIVRVNHFEDGELLKFLVMEYVAGETLARRLARERRLSEAEARRIGVALCDALSQAHARGVLHRDVKPANVLLGSDGSIKLADFGIAYAARESVSRLSKQERPTSGTLAYMAPEQVEGEKPAAAGNLYGLGVVLYEIVAGELPFAPAGDLTYQILNKPAAVLQGVSDEYAELVARLLAKQAAERPRDAAAVREVLDGTAARRREEEARRQAEEEVQRRRLEEESRRREEERRLQREAARVREAEEARRREDKARRAAEEAAGLANEATRRLPAEEQRRRAATSAEPTRPDLVSSVGIVISILGLAACLVAVAVVGSRSRPLPSALPSELKPSADVAGARPSPGVS